MSGAGTYVYVISCTLERVKIGVADDPRKRLRELQVGSPVELTLAHTQPYAERRDAVAVCEELYRCFAGRRVRGSWYRLTLAEVRQAFSRRATLEAPERARAAAGAAEEDTRVPARLTQSRKRTQKQLAYERRRRQERTRKQKRAARLVGQGMTQDQAAAAVDVTTRTLRNWKAAPAFRRELERQREHAARPPASAPSSAGKTDGLLLSVFPILLVFASFQSKPLLRRLRGRVAVGALALAASLAFTAVYHMGYPEFRGENLRKPVAGDLVWSVPTLFTLSPLGSPIAHAGLHVSAVVHSYDTDTFLPPH
jgi:hypothetical protein